MKVGIIQITSVLDPLINLNKLRIYLKEAKLQNVEAVFLSECFYSMSDGSESTPFLVEKGNQHYNAIASLAKEFSMYIIGGTAATKGENGSVLNRAYNFSPTGEDLGHYDKMHLFSCEIKSNSGIKKIDEGDIYTAGNIQNSITLKNGVKIGLGVCVDLRYPNFFRNYKNQGCSILTISSAFTVPTGKAHWHTLVRARAIENQCFVIAAGQYGQNNEKISTYGHSLIVDPWGNVLADGEEGEKLITAEIDFGEIEKIESMVKVNFNE